MLNYNNLGTNSDIKHSFKFMWKKLCEFKSGNTLNCISQSESKRRLKPYKCHIIMWCSRRLNCGQHPPCLLDCTRSRTSGESLSTFIVVSVLRFESLSDRQQMLSQQN